MAEYILDVKSQTSKLDWAFPFQRTGAFPLDRSVLFSSLEDAKKYAVGDGSDERALGGTSYVGQIISVLDSEEVSAYVITKARGLMKLAATTATGDIAQDVADLQGKLDALSSTVEAMGEQLDTLESSIDGKIADAVAKADHLTRIIVDSLEDIDPETANENAIYMVKNDEKYDEYMVVNGALEKLGDWSVDLSDYYTSKEVDEKLEALELGDENFVKSVSADFAVSAAGKLSLNELPQSKITGLEDAISSFNEFMTKQATKDAQQDEALANASSAVSELRGKIEALDDTYVSETEFSTRVGDLNSLFEAVGKESTTIVEEIVKLRDMLVWGSLEN